MPAISEVAEAAVGDERGPQEMTVGIAEEKEIWIFETDTQMREAEKENATASVIGIAIETASETVTETGVNPETFDHGGPPFLEGDRHCGNFEIGNVTCLLESTQRDPDEVLVMVGHLPQDPPLRILSLD